MQQIRGRVCRLSLKGLTDATYMSLLPLPSACKRVAPRCNHVLKEAGPSARRLLERLWAAYEVMWGIPIALVFFYV